MDCSKAEKLLVEYLYQELSPEKTLEMEKHLETCDACAKTLENWRGIHRGFQRSNDIPQPQPFLKTRILAAAREEAERRPSLAERLLFWVKPAVILPVVIFGLLVLLFMPARQSDMAKAKAPAQAETTSTPAVAAQREAQPAEGGRVTTKEVKDLKALGYVGGEKTDQPSTEAYSDELRRKEEVDAERSRDQEVSSTLDDKAKKTGYFGEPAAAPTAPGKREPSAVYEAQPADVAPQENKLAEKQVAAPAPALQSPPQAAPSQAASGLVAGTKPDETEANFQKAQFLSKNNDLPQAKKAAEDAIRTDKDRALASQFHEAGRQYQSQGEPQQAILQYNLVLKNYPDYSGSPDVLLRLGESYEQVGEYVNAIRTYEQLGQIASMKKVADEKMRTLTKKKQVQEQLRSLGYVDKN